MALGLIFVSGNAAAPSAAVSGTLSGGISEALIVSTGGTIIITLSNDTWVASGATFNAQRQNIIDGLDAASTPTNGWNNEIRDALDVSAVARTSDTVCTITVPATATYDIDSDETITVTVPASALVSSGSPLTATPTLSIEAVVVSVGAGGRPNRLKKKEDPDELREAARLALLRRQRRELLQAERERALKATAPEDAQKAQKRLFQIDRELEALHDEMIAIETENTERVNKRRKRDKLAALLLIN